MNIKSVIRWFAIALPAAFVLAAVLLHFFGIRWFYYPFRGETQTPQDSGFAYEDVYFTSTDGTRLHAWFIPAQGTVKGTVFHVHGNGGNLGFNIPPVLWLAASGYNIFTFDYRGYGLSDDKSPNPKALMEDTRSALRYLQARADVDASRLFVVAHSLGGNNLMAALSNGDTAGIAAIVLDATFYSYSEIANDKIPGTRFLTSDTYSASRHIASLSPIPLLILHGDSDEVIPYKHSKMLYDAANEPKQLIILPGVRHLQVLYQPEMQKKVLAFFAQAGAPQ